MSTESDSVISPEEILSNEFDYIAQTAAQANEDRSSVISFFLIAVGSPLAAFFSTEMLGNSSSNLNSVSILFCGLFFILTVLGTTTILQLARLRAAWHESMMAMNHLKEFVVMNSSVDISAAFRWKTNTVPAKFKINSVSFFQAMEVAILSGLLFGAFTFFLFLAFNISNSPLIWGSSIGLGLFNIAFQILLYRHFVNK